MPDCTHQCHKTPRHMSESKAMSMLRAKNEICWMSKIITNCQDCGADISHARVVLVKTVKEYLAE